MDVTNNLSNLGSDLSARAVISMAKGDTKLSITSITITNTYNCTATSGIMAGINYNDGYIQLQSVSQNNGVYYENGSVTVDIAYTDNGTGKTFSGVKINFYANLLGKWEEKIVGDTKSAIAQSRLFSLDSNGNIVSSDYLGEYLQSSVENKARLTEMTGQYDAMVVGHEDEIDLSTKQIGVEGDVVLIDYNDYFTDDLIERCTVGYDPLGDVAHWETAGANFVPINTCYLSNETDHIYQATLTGWNDLGEVSESFSELKQRADSISARVGTNEGKISQLEITAG